MTTTATKPAAVTAKPRAAIGRRRCAPTGGGCPALVTVVGLTAWLAYASVRVFMQRWYWVEEYHYLTPFYSPVRPTAAYRVPPHFGRFLPGPPADPVRRAQPAVPAAVPAHLLLLPQGVLPRLLALAAGLRGAGRRTRRYTGETRFPLIFQNLHRYFVLRAPVIISLINTYDAILAFHGDERLRVRRWATSSCSATWSCSGRTPSPATPAGTSSAAG